MISTWWLTKLILMPTAIGSGPRWRLLDLIRDSGTEVWMVLIILLGFSVISWAIIAAKAILIRRTNRASAAFFRAYEQQPTFSNIYKEIETQNLQTNPFASIFLKGYRELLRISSTPRQASPQHEGVVQEPARLTVEWRGFESVERAVRQEGAIQIHRYEKALSFLATTGSTAPFVGLFGTVLGIIRSFHEIGLRGSASLATVAPGISEALVATAAGLAAAIPAVVAYNFFVQRIRGLASEMDQFTTELLNLVERQLRPQRVQRQHPQPETAQRRHLPSQPQ
jgi:biopolymer transport protein TolQ